MQYRIRDNKSPLIIVNISIYRNITGLVSGHKILHIYYEIEIYEEFNNEIRNYRLTCISSLNSINKKLFHSKSIYIHNKYLEHLKFLHVSSFYRVCFVSFLLPVAKDKLFSSRHAAIALDA